MVRRSLVERLAQLEAQKRTLSAKLTKQERARDTRRKVLLGALMLHRLDGNLPDNKAIELRAWLQNELPGFLSRNRDILLFDDLLPSDLLERTRRELASSPKGA